PTINYLQSLSIKYLDPSHYRICPGLLAPRHTIWVFVTGTAKVFPKTQPRLLGGSDLRLTTTLRPRSSVWADAATMVWE
ncbi:MAG: hypothetical protein WCL11_17440, partial [Verrucomicrobiota bacterium]